MDPARQARPLRELIGVQLQSTAIPEELTPLETLRLFAGLFRRSIPPMELLERMKMVDKAKSRNTTLSGGQRQRLTVAMALINDPELIILDEPTSGLDPSARHEMHTYIAGLKGSKKTILLSTHYIEEAEKLCDRVVFIRAGNVIADGTPRQLIARSDNASPAVSIALAGKFDSAPLLQAGAVEQKSDGGYRYFIAKDVKAAISALAKILQLPDVSLVDVRMKHPSLEDIYLDLMGEQAQEPREGL
jgi:ABC-2 type transport system ATP-binding protein